MWLDRTGLLYSSRIVGQFGNAPLRTLMFFLERWLRMFYRSAGRGGARIQEEACATAATAMYKVRVWSRAGTKDTNSLALGGSRAERLLLHLHDRFLSHYCSRTRSIYFAKYKYSFLSQLCKKEAWLQGISKSLREAWVVVNLVYFHSL